MSHAIDTRVESSGPMDATHTLRVADVMTRSVVTVSPRTSFADVVDQLYRSGFNVVPVVGQDGALLGLISEADLITKEAYTDGERRRLGVIRDYLAGRDPEWIRKSGARTASDLMTMDVDTSSPNDNLAIAARRMLEGHHKSLPVVQDGRLVGIVTRHDLLTPIHRPDPDITADVAALLADPLRAPEAHEARAQVADGVVTLAGSTRWLDDANVLAALIARLPGVVAVNNHLTFREAAPQQESHIRLGFFGPQSADAD
jgi:CBS domain-containing protein